MRVHHADITCKTTVDRNSNSFILTVDQITETNDNTCVGKVTDTTEDTTMDRNSSSFISTVDRISETTMFIVTVLCEYICPFISNGAI